MAGGVLSRWYFSVKDFLKNAEKRLDKID